MMGRLALGLLGGLGKGMLAAGGGKAALGLARTALGSLGGRGQGCGGGGRQGGKGRGGQRGGQQELPLEDILQALLGESTVQAPTSAHKTTEAPLQATVIDVRPEGSAAMQAPDEAALRCLAVHISSFVDGRVRVRHPALQEQGPALEELRRQLQMRPGMQEVSFNPTTGSALLRYDAARLDRLAFLAAALPLGAYLAGKGLPEGAALALADTQPLA